jgi:hypothetical protein
LRDQRISAHHPLADTAARADATRDWLSITFGEPVPDGWVRCSDVDVNVVAGWEARVGAWHQALFDRTHPLATSGYVLSYYADIAPTVGAMFFLLDRRVPCLDRASLAYRTDTEHAYPDGIAVLGRTFWCLPDDEAASHPDATVVPDEQALGEVLRTRVRRHADDLLSTYQPGARLPRRNLLGAFYDALDGGFRHEVGDPQPPEACARAAGLVLPGPTPEFTQGSSYYMAVDEAGGEHLTRRRAGCCYYFKVGDEGACTTCPRTSDDERAERLAALAAEAGS